MRKAVFLISLIASLVVASTAAYPAELNLGPNNFAVKLDSIHFSAKGLKDFNNAFYMGLEGYGDLGNNFYIGSEVGYVDKKGKTDKSGTQADRELIFIPMELNLKYTVKVVSRLIFDVGGGFSYNYAREEISEAGASSTVNEWLWGGQFFGDLNYKIGQFFLGANLKYQLTKNGRDLGHNFDNLRVGGQIGVMF
jgi:hypothetical protein